MKRIICFVLIAVIAAAALTACGENTRKLDRIDVGSVKHATIATQANAEPEFDIQKRKGLVALVDMYNSAVFADTDEVKAEELLAEKVYAFTFYDFDGKVIGECTYSPKGYLLLPEDPAKPYLMKEGFDAEAIEEVIATYDVHALPK